MGKLQRMSGQFLALVVLSGMFVFILSRANFASSIGANEAMPKRSEKKFGLDNFKTLRDIAEDLENLYLHTSSIANRSMYKSQKGTIDDGYIAISSSIEKLMKLSESERKLEIDKMAALTRREIERLQNPVQCSESPLLVYDLSEEVNCGFGAALHTVVIALMQAFLTKRTLVLKSEGWLYATEGWAYMFSPLGNCTTATNITDLPLLQNAHSEKEVAAEPKRKSAFEHWTVPREFAPKLKELHGDPFAWWVAQFASYIFRFQPWFQKKIDKLAEEIGFSESVACIQIRWGDKVNQNAGEKFPVEQYMEHVENWYKRLEHKGQKVERVVFLATEDLLARKQITTKFPEYKFIMLQPWTNKKYIYQKARFNHRGLTSIAMDIHFLSRCSYLVCTMSSSVCRTAYELMLTRHTDTSTRFHSLDTRHRLKTQHSRLWTAILDHRPSRPEELDLKKRDGILTYLGKLQNFNKGFATGRNIRTNQTGIFPAFKARANVKVYNVPVFTDPDA